MSGTVPGTPAACGVALEPRLKGAAGRACAQTYWPSQSGDQQGVAGVRHHCPVPEVPFAALPETPPPSHWLERVSWPYLLQPRGPDQRHGPPPGSGPPVPPDPDLRPHPRCPGVLLPGVAPLRVPVNAAPPCGLGRRGQAERACRRPRYCDTRRLSSVRRWTTFLEETGNHSTMLFFYQPSLPHLPCRPLFF